MMRSEPGFDWVVLRRRIEEFAAERSRPPSVAELRRFLAEHDIGPELLGTFLASMAEPKMAPASKPKPSHAEAPALRVPAPVLASRLQTAPTKPPPAVDASPVGEYDEPAPRLTGRLAEVVEDLVDDWHRQGGVLQRTQVISLAAKRRLTGAELATVDQELIRLGVEAPAGVEDREDHQRPRRTPASGDADLIGAYLAEIARYRLIDAEEEVKLGRAIHAGQRAVETLAGRSQMDGPTVERLQAAAAEGRAAHTRLVETNLRLVVSVARQSRYAATTTEFIDRIQDGNQGLMRAADKFDPELGFKFSTYATWWIKQVIERSIADTGRAIRIPVHVYEKLSKLRRIRHRLGERLDREPTVVELVEATGYSPGEVQAMTDYLAPIRSLEEPIGPDATLLDLLADRAEDVDGDPQDHLLAADQRHELDAILDLLPIRQRQILVRRYGLDGGAVETLDTIGHDLGITRERVRQLEKKSLVLLQSSPQVGVLYDYLITDTRLDRPRPSGGWPAPPPPKTKSGVAAAAAALDPEGQP